MGLFGKPKGGATETAAPRKFKRKPVMAGNWKMNKTTAEAVTLSQNISWGSNKAEWKELDVILCPPFVDLKSVYNVIAFDRASMELGAQDVFWEEEGAFTGAISPRMLSEIHCAYCIVGHSERRGYFHETDEDVNKKVKALIAHDIKPIVCCGESLEVREANGTLEHITRQVEAAFADVDPQDIAESIIAYEPIWAIGTGHAATPEQAQEVCAHIRSVIASVAGSDVADKIRILYGGSMKPENAAQFLPLPDVDGGLIGGAALDAKKFCELVDLALKHCCEK